MATFVKLSNGDVVNAQHIKSIKRHEYSSSEDWATAMQRRRLGPEKGPYLQTTPSIQLQLSGEHNPVLLKYESEQERDAEFERIEKLLTGQPTILFSTLALRPELIQSLHIEWAGQTDSVLKIRIKAANTNTFVVLVRQKDAHDWAQAQALITQFGLTIPKTMRERMAEHRKEDYA